MKKLASFAVFLLLIMGFVAWCYLPSGNAQHIAFKMKIPLPSLYSRSVSYLQELNTQEAIAILVKELSSGNREHRILAAEALSKTGWVPSNQDEQAWLFVAQGQYQNAATIGVPAVPALIEEIEDVDEPAIQSQLCTLLLNSGDPQALSAVESYLREKMNKIEVAVQQALPQETKASASIEEVSPSARRLVVTGHLLEGEEPSDDSPYVRGDYANKQALESKVKYRVFQIYQAILRDIPMTEFQSIAVICNHGVRVEIRRNIGGSSVNDQSMTIFQTSLTTASAANINWDEAKVEDAEKVWTVDKNEIPSLQFEMVPG